MTDRAWDGGGQKTAAEENKDRLRTITDGTQGGCPKMFCEEDGFEDTDELSTHLRYQHGYSNHRAHERANEVFR